MLTASEYTPFDAGMTRGYPRYACLQIAFGLSGWVNLRRRQFLIVGIFRFRFIFQMLIVDVTSRP